MRAAAGRTIQSCDSYASGVFVRSSGNPLACGSVFANRYRIIRNISQTALSKVFVVHDLQQNKRVILKTARLDSYGNADPEFILKAFETEAKVLKMELHPMFPTLYESGQHKNIPYIAMEYIQGQSLFRLISGPKKITLRRAIRIVIQILAGLKALHDQGWVYRDLKPENIFVCGDQVRLIDFNLACLIKEQKEGGITGTPDYLSPEQASTKAARKNSDLYSLGLMFYEMLTGINPMHDPRIMTTIKNHLDKEMPMFPIETIEERIPVEKRKSVINSIIRVHDWLRLLISQMTEKDPYNRFQSTEDIITYFQSQGITPDSFKPHESAA